VRDVANTTLIASVTGIVVSGVVGPTATAWATRRAARSQFLRDRGAARRDELRGVLDEAAVLLGVGATRLRQAWEAHQSHTPDSALQAWSEQVFAMGQRLRLRLPSENAVVKAYEVVRTRLVEASQLLSGAGDRDHAYEAALAAFEDARTSFLSAAQVALDAPITAKEPGR
jgi:hypothetical protein